MKKFLNAIDDKAQALDARYWQAFLRHLDRYGRKGRHHDRPGSVSGYAMRAWLKERSDKWQETCDHYGINAAIDLGL